jgi:MoaA/NifB/PqqE/SkfB family radical SAM enzyme
MGHGIVPRVSQLTKQQSRERNVDAVRGLLMGSGMALVPDAPFEVESLDAPDFESAVHITLNTADGPLVIRLENNDPRRQAFARTPSFGVSHSGQASRLQVELLRDFVTQLAAHDPGDKRLVHPSPIGVSGGEAANSGSRPGTFWSRQLFEGRFAQLERLPERNGGVTVVVPQACEMNCVFCPEADRAGLSLIAPNSSRDQLLEDLILQLERGRVLGADTVEFGGNDVLRFKDAIELFNAAGRLGYTRIIAQSPAQILADPRFAEKVAATPLTEVWVPIYGATADLHDAVVRVPGAFQKLVQAIDAVTKLGRPAVRLHTIALSRTLPHLDEIIRFCRERFDRPVLVACLRPNRQGEVEHLSDMVRFTDAAEVIERHPMHFFEYPLCVYPEEAALEVYRVRQQLMDGLKRPANFFDLGLSRDSEEDLVRQARSVQFPEPCNDCLLKSACPAIIGAYIERFGASEIKPFTDVAKVEAALERRGDPFPNADLPLRHRVDLITGICNLTEPIAV